MTLKVVLITTKQKHRTTNVVLQSHRQHLPLNCLLVLAHAPRIDTVIDTIMDLIQHLMCLRASLVVSGVSALPAGTRGSSIPVLFCWGCMPAVSCSLLRPLEAQSGAVLLYQQTLSLHKRTLYTKNA